MVQKKRLIIVEIPLDLKLGKDDIFLLAQKVAENENTVTGQIPVDSTSTKEKIAYQVVAGKLRIRKLPISNICTPIASIINTTALERTPE